ncbi:MAG: hypothetical protein SFZ03_00035 [Candidatus Melainabacteria bacterium]|nr:hypothetical protein [Candidatus Melainabacteria bacterium]
MKLMLPVQPDRRNVLANVAAAAPAPVAIKAVGANTVASGVLTSDAYCPSEPSPSLRFGQAAWQNWVPTPLLNWAESQRGKQEIANLAREAKQFPEQIEKLGVHIEQSGQVSLQYKILNGPSVNLEGRLSPYQSRNNRLTLNLDRDRHPFNHPKEAEQQLNQLVEGLQTAFSQQWGGMQIIPGSATAAAPRIYSRVFWENLAQQTLTGQLSWHHSSDDRLHAELLNQEKGTRWSITVREPLETQRETRPQVIIHEMKQSGGSIQRSLYFPLEKGSIEASIVEGIEALLDAQSGVAHASRAAERAKTNLQTAEKQLQSLLPPS